MKRRMSLKNQIRRVLKRAGPKTLAWFLDKKANYTCLVFPRLNDKSCPYSLRPCKKCSEKIPDFSDKYKEIRKACTVSFIMSLPEDRRLQIIKYIVGEPK